MAAAFFGLQTHDFPNAFFMGFTQTAFTFLVPFTLNEQAKHLAYILAQTRRRGAGVVEATQAAEDGWCAEMASKAHLGDEFYESCTPGYYNNEGAITNRFGVYANMYGGGPMKFLRLLDAWRADGRMDGEALSDAPAADGHNTPSPEPVALEAPVEPGDANAQPV